MYVAEPFVCGGSHSNFFFEQNSQLHSGCQLITAIRNHPFASADRGSIESFC